MAQKSLYQTKIEQFFDNKNFCQVIRQVSSYSAHRKSAETTKQSGSSDKYPPILCLFKLTKEALEQGVKYL